MVSLEHEILVAIVREHPELVLGLLRTQLGIEHAGAVEVLASAENLSDLVPAEYRADAVLIVRDSEGATSSAIVVEVQLRPDPRKRFTWPAYVVNTRARFECPVELVVITLDAATARWCATPIELNARGWVLQPDVIGPAAVPIVDARVAGRHPELAVVSLLAHRHAPIAVDLGRALLRACDDLDPDRGELYADIVFSFINDAARRALEAEMHIENYQVQSDFLRQLKARANAEGQAEAWAAAVLRVVDARRLAITEAQRTTISQCRDATALERWLDAAVTAATVDDVLLS